MIKFESHQPVETDAKIKALTKSKGNKKKMLTSLSAKFVQFFLDNPRTVTLEEAAVTFCDPTASFSKIKTKVGRLYDISNVFLALGLVQKTTVDSRKPAFDWIGLQGYLKIQEKIFAEMRSE